VAAATDLSKGAPIGSSSVDAIMLTPWRAREAVRSFAIDEIAYRTQITQ